MQLGGCNDCNEVRSVTVDLCHCSPLGEKKTQHTNRHLYYPIASLSFGNTTGVWTCLDTVSADPMLEAVSRGLERGQKDFDDTSLCIGNRLSPIFPLL